MAAIHDLIEQIPDPRLRARLAAEWEAASKGRKFGLVFEDHLPELVPLYNVSPRKGDLVCLKNGPLKDLWEVKKANGNTIECCRPVAYDGTKGRSTEQTKFPATDLLVVRQFGEPVFPTLTPIDSISNGGEKAPWHSLIEADNYHALQLLDYLYQNQVDCIYIDPPYNTGARDWKYNNDYVDKNDAWRHSKWLAFMERRLKLAKRLLKVDSGVLIVTIDDNESHHLRCLLSDLFPNHNIFNIVIEHNKRGRQGEEFAKTHEYAFVVCPDKPDVISEEPTDGMIGGETRNLRRTGNNSLRTDRIKQFYPIWVDPETMEIVRAGAFLALDEERDDRPSHGLIPIWPIDKQGIERNWYYGPDRLMAEYAAGKVFARKQKHGVHVYYTLKEKTSKRYKTVWSKPTLDASTYGSEFLTKVFGTTAPFTYPKSIYAVRDCIATVCLNRPDALILDFFAGSGTTLNAVNLLNAGDGGNRRCILVTNNEVSAEDAEQLRAEGFESNDQEWQAKGICRSVTWPRSKLTILGQRSDGSALVGDYLTGKVAVIERPRRFVHVGFIDANSLDTVLKRQQLIGLIEALPKSAVKTMAPFIVSDSHEASVLFDISASEEWLEALADQNHISTFYIVTPDKKLFEKTKRWIDELLGPMLSSCDETRPMKSGFPANLAYFKLEFLNKEKIALKQAFREVLPLLWLKAGAVGPRPILAEGTAPPFLIPPANNFAVLLDESRVSKMLSGLAEREDLMFIFIATDADESFKAIATEVRERLKVKNPNVALIQLYRDYLVNFMINQRADLTNPNVFGELQ